MKYLYNGVKLPALPEYDEGVYSSAVIVRFLSNDGYGLFCSSLPFWVVNANGTDTIALPVDSEVLCFTCSAGAGSWQAADSGFDPDPDALWIYMNPAAYQYVWTLRDICRENSTEVVYYGSEPVPVAWKKHFLTGLALGLCGERLPVVPETQDVPNWVPTAYLYNDVRLPPLPAWNEKEYPYAVIEGYKDTYPYSTHVRYLLVSREPLVVHKGSTGEPMYLWGLKGALNWLCRPTDGYSSWEYVGTYSYDSRLCWSGGESNYNQHRFFWSNYDVVDTDHNSVFCGKSKPVPVYE